LINFDGMSKSSALHSSVAMQLRWGGTPCNTYSISSGICL